MKRGAYSPFEVFTRVSRAIQWGHELEEVVRGANSIDLVLYQVFVLPNPGDVATPLGPRYATAVGALGELERRLASHPRARICRVITTFDLTEQSQRRALVRVVIAGDREAAEMLE